MNAIKNWLGNTILTMAAMPLYLLLLTKPMRRFAQNRLGLGMKLNSNCTMTFAELVAAGAQRALLEASPACATQPVPPVPGAGTLSENDQEMLFNQRHYNQQRKDEENELQTRLDTYGNSGFNLAARTVRNTTV